MVGFIGLGLALAFIAGTALMYLKGRFERYLLFFMIRTKRGIRLIERLALLHPELWTFLADFTIVASFGGVGAAYVSRQDESRKNTPAIIFITGVVASLLWSLSLKEILYGTLLSAMILLLSRKNRSVFYDSIAATALISLIGLRIFIMPYMAVIVGLFGASMLLIAGLLLHAVDILSGASTLPGVSPLLPDSREGKLGVSFPGYDLFIPWFYALIAIVVTMIAHEFSHGVLSVVNKVKIKSVGLLTFGILPVGAFVEPDEEELNSRPSIERMRLYVVGSAGNFFVGFLAGILLLASTPWVQSSLVYEGLEIIDFDKGYPAEKALEKGMVIEEINGKPAINLNLFRNATAGIKPGEEITIKTSKGVYTVNSTADPKDGSKAYIGVLMMEKMRLGGSLGDYGPSMSVLFFILMSLSWISFFNINIGLVNLLPIIPFDGGKMLKELISAFSINELSVKRILYGVVAFTAVVFVVNTFPLIQLLIDYVIKLFGF